MLRRYVHTKGKLAKPPVSRFHPYHFTIFLFYLRFESFRVAPPVHRIFAHPSVRQALRFSRRFLDEIPRSFTATIVLSSISTNAFTPDGPFQYPTNCSETVLQDDPPPQEKKTSNLTVFSRRSNTQVPEIAFALRRRLRPTVFAARHVGNVPFEVAQLPDGRFANVVLQRRILQTRFVHESSSLKCARIRQCPRYQNGRRREVVRRPEIRGISRSALFAVKSCPRGEGKLYVTLFSWFRVRRTFRRLVVSERRTFRRRVKNVRLRPKILIPIGIRTKSTKVPKLKKDGLEFLKR